MSKRRLRLGMIGGGEGAFIGGVHRMAARIDNRWELVAGAFQSDPARSVAFGESLGLDRRRCYGDAQSMLKTEAGRDDRIDAVAIVTPNHLHHPMAALCLDAGFPVICDKPLAVSMTQATDLRSRVQQSRVPFVLTHNYTGYAMVRQARGMIEAGELGAIRVVQVEYAQDWLAKALPGNKQADWRGDPDRAGPGGALGDIATHAFQLAEYVTRLKTVAVSADTSAFVAGRQLDDNVNALLRFDGGARGILWASQVAHGNANGLRLRVFGEAGGIEWAQETPETLTFTPEGQPSRTLRRGGPETLPVAASATRTPPGHPEGYLEGFAQIYADAAELVWSHIDGADDGQIAGWLPGISDGVRGVGFIEAVLASHKQDGVWTPIQGD